MLTNSIFSQAQINTADYLPTPKNGHGTVTMYMNKKCRCADCRARWSEYQRAYREKNPRRGK